MWVFDQAISKLTTTNFILNFKDVVKEGVLQGLFKLEDMVKIGQTQTNFVKWPYTYVWKIYMKKGLGCTKDKH